MSPILAPTFLTFLLVLVFYPGFMSYDTLHALHSAREGVTESIWPPMVSYIWRAVDSVYPDPGLMFFLQVLLLLVSLSFLAYFLSGNLVFSIVFLVIYLSIPVVIGTVIVIWKDVLMAAFFMAAFALLTRYGRIKKDKAVFGIFFGIFLLIFLGVCIRHNAIFGAVPLFFLYSYFLLCNNNLNKISFFLLFFALAISFSATAFLGKSLLDSYSLPQFKKLESNTDIFLRQVRVLDIAGASVCEGKNLFGELAPGLSVEDIQAGYDPRHINLSATIVNKIPLDERVNRIWRRTAREHPLCFLYNKSQLTKHMLGLGDKEQFLITHPKVDDNEYGYKLAPSKIRDSIVVFIVAASKLLIFKPWFIYIMMIILMFIAVASGDVTVDLLALFSSAIFYFAGLVVFGNAADARLPFYTTTSFLLVLSIILFRLFRSRSKANHGI